MIMKSFQSNKISFNGNKNYNRIVTVPVVTYYLKISITGSKSVISNCTANILLVIDRPVPGDHFILQYLLLLYNTILLIG